MNITTYFIKHPVIALVLSSMIILLGALCFNSLPIREYPQVNFPTVTINTNYPNASAELVESSVTNILEDRLAGIEGIDTLVSQSKYGASSIEISFHVGTSIDRSLIAIRDAIGLAKGNLPKEIRDPIVERKTQSNGPPFMAVSIESPTADFGALTHWANLNLKNAFRSLKGVASADVWGEPYTYKITLDPKKMYAFGVNADEVFKALEKNNVSLPVGKFQNEVPVTLNSELKTTEAYENLVIKEKNFKDPKNKQHPILLKSIAHIELATDDQHSRFRINGNKGLCLAINKSTDSNPVEVSTLVHEQVKALSENLPSDIKIKVILDQADFIKSSLKNIESSIVEAILFVLVIVFLFLRNLGATLIPLVTIPVSLIGSLLFLKLFGYSINIMTLLAMVLAIGLVVDDAIIVLENISRHLENGLSSIEAAIKGAKEIGFAIVAMTLTLASVYAPIAFVHGVVGQLFVEFAVALAGSVLISGVVALTLSPLMCARFLKQDSKHFLPGVDRFLNDLSNRYKGILEYILLHKKTVLALAFGSLGLTILFFKILPSETAPKEDRSLIGIWLPPIPGKSMDTMYQKTIEVEKMIGSLSEAKDTLLFVGDWGGSIVIQLKPKTERKRSATALTNILRPKAMSLPSLEAYAWNWESGLPGMDDAFGGAELALVVSTVDSYRHLFENVEKVRKIIEEKKTFDSIRHDLNLDSLGYAIDLDTNLLAKLNLNQSQVAKMIEVFFSGDESLSFAKDGLRYAITLRGADRPWTLDEIYITNPNGERISMGAFAKMVSKAEPKELNHYNQMRSATLRTAISADQKIETAMPKLLKVADEALPSTYKKTWTGAAKAYQQSSTTMALLFVLAIVFIFAILAVQFESFVDPLIVLFTVPLACSGALFVAWISGGTLNVYTQVGLITLIGLITKHGILIVEFANQLWEKGTPLLGAIQQSAILRLRPILMTTGAMVFGLIPLILSQDDGSEARQAIGMVLIGGLGFGTLFTLFVLPTVYYVVKSSMAKIQGHS